MSSSLLFLSVVIYLFLPIFIFVLGWVTPPIAVTVALITIIAIYFSMKNIWKENRNVLLPCSISELVWVYIFFFLFLIFLGHSDLFPQDFDWDKHHAIFYDLVNYEWPVVYQNDSMLTYYLGQYIVPAGLAKLMGSAIESLTFFVPMWNALGLTLVYACLNCFLNAKSRLKKVGILLIIVFFGGCTNLGQLIYNNLGYETVNSYKWIDLNRVKVHFASNYDALYGAFQHVIAPWLSCCLFLGNKKNKEAYVLMALPLLFSATFGFVYFCALLFAFAVYEVIKSKNRIGSMKQIFSAGNLLLLPVSIVLLIYLSGNFLGNKPDDVGFSVIPIFQYYDFYIIFLLVEFFLYAICLFPRNRKNVLFYMIIGELFIISFLSLGLYNDLCSRGSIPARFILMYYCMEQLYNSNFRKWENIGLSVFLVIAALNTGLQIKDHIDQTLAAQGNISVYLFDHYKSFEGYAGDIDYAGRVDNAYNYFTLDYSESLFHIIAKK